MSDLGHLLQKGIPKFRKNGRSLQGIEEAAQTVNLTLTERQSVTAYLEILGAILSTKEKAFRED